MHVTTRKNRNMRPPTALALATAAATAVAVAIAVAATGAHAWGLAPPPSRSGGPLLRMAAARAADAGFIEWAREELGVKVDKMEPKSFGGLRGTSYGGQFGRGGVRM